MKAHTGDYVRLRKEVNEQSLSGDYINCCPKNTVAKVISRDRNGITVRIPSGHIPNIVFHDDSYDRLYQAEGEVEYLYAKSRLVCTDHLRRLVKRALNDLKRNSGGCKYRFTNNSRSTTIHCMNNGETVPVDCFTELSEWLSKWGRTYSLYDQIIEVTSD
jgi:hypothetical protein